MSPVRNYTACTISFFYSLPTQTAGRWSIYSLVLEKLNAQLSEVEQSQDVCYLEETELIRYPVRLCRVRRSGLVLS